jgi:hypothetical protein
MYRDLPVRPDVTDVSVPPLHTSHPRWELSSFDVLLVYALAPTWCRDTYLTTHRSCWVALASSWVMLLLLLFSLLYHHICLDLGQCKRTCPEPMSTYSLTYANTKRGVLSMPA